MSKHSKHQQIYSKSGLFYPSGWHVHHIDGNHEHNELNNLIALPHYFHEYIHRAFRKNLPDKQIIQELLIEWLWERKFLYTENKDCSETSHDKDIKKRKGTLDLPNF